MATRPVVNFIRQGHSCHLIATRKLARMHVWDCGSGIRDGIGGIWASVLYIRYTRFTKAPLSVLFRQQSGEVATGYINRACVRLSTDAKIENKPWVFTFVPTNNRVNGGACHPDLLLTILTYCLAICPLNYFTMFFVWRSSHTITASSLHMMRGNKLRVFGLIGTFAHQISKSSLLSCQTTKMSPLCVTCRAPSSRSRQVCAPGLPLSRCERLDSPMNSDI